MGNLSTKIDKMSKSVVSIDTNFNVNDGMKRENKAMNMTNNNYFRVLNL